MSVVIGSVAAGSVVAARRAPTQRLTVAEKRPAAGESELTGYWVWSATVAPDGSRDAIDEVDLQPRPGAGGWPGCPEAFLCTRFGVRTLAFGPTGGFHYVANVFTSSDFQHHGSHAGDDVRISQRWSCAHPGWHDAPHRTMPFHHRRESGELWAAVDARVTDGSWPFADQPTGSWWVFRRITRGRYYADFLRMCQPDGEHRCAPGCFSSRLVR